MPTITSKLNFDIERKDASIILGISLRTIDRYLKSGKLKYSRDGQRILLSKDEVMRFKSTIIEEIDSIDIVEDLHKQNKKEKNEYKNQDNFDQQSNVFGMTKENFENIVYRELYIDAKNDLLKKQKEVEMLNYSLGKMEYELKNTIPLLEYNNNIFQIEEEHEKITQQIQVKELEIESVAKSVRIEKFNKNVYLGIAIFLLMICILLLTMVM